MLRACNEKWTAANSDARRLFHGRGHTYPDLEHLVINWLPPYLQITVYAPVAEAELRQLLDALLEIKPDIEGAVVQFREGRKTHCQIWHGTVPEEHVVNEAGLSFLVQPITNQNIGLFMDMSHVRAALAEQMPGKRVLNLFAYTCAFSVSALAHGASLVVNNDMSKNALEWGERNHALNQQDLRRVRMVPHNLFKSWWKIKQFGSYDVLIIDPPTNQRGSFVAEKSYGQVLKRIPDLANPGATILACLNSPFLESDFLKQQMQRWCPSAVFVRRLPLHPDFPDAFPERGLKVMEFSYPGLIPTTLSSRGVFNRPAQSALSLAMRACT